ncbi:MAG: hypothetical protein ACQEUT_01660 [Bacillota bacterium]
MIYRVFAFIFGIIGIAVIGYGQYHWQQNAVVDTRTVSAAVENNRESEENEIDGDMPLSDLSLEKLKDVTSLLPQEAQETFMTAYENGETVSLLILGSPAIGDDEGAAQLMKEGIESVYGEKFLEVDTYTYDGNSRELVEEIDTLTELAAPYDFVLLEPFTMIDNGEVGVPENHSNIEAVQKHFTDLNGDTVFFFTPALPIYEASIYPRQVEDLKEYADAETIPFIDHWSAWPDYFDPEFLDYINDDAYPNAEGAKVWADEVAGFFTNS